MYGLDEMKSTEMPFSCWKFWNRNINEVFGHVTLRLYEGFVLAAQLKPLNFSFASRLSFCPSS